MSDDQEGNDQAAPPLARMHWIKIVAGNDRSLVIASILLLLGATISWYSISKISSLSKPPERYNIYAELVTTGCEDHRFELSGSIGSFGISGLEVSRPDGSPLPGPDGGCWIESIELESDALLPSEGLPERVALLSAVGFGSEQFQFLNKPYRQLYELGQVSEDILADVIDGAIDIRDPETVEARGVQLSYVESNDERAPANASMLHSYKISFGRDWQPQQILFNFVLEDNIKTYFNLYTVQTHAQPSATDASEISYDPLDIRVGFRTDDVSVVRGSITESGEAIGVNGGIRFGVENNDAESRRESGNITYSALLGIGIAALMEAFVLILAVAVFAIRVPGRGRK